MVLIFVVERITQVYEQEREELNGSPRLGLYVKRWMSWIQSGLGNYDIPVPESESEKRASGTEFSRLVRTAFSYTRSPRTGKMRAPRQPCRIC